MTKEPSTNKSLREEINFFFDFVDDPEDRNIKVLFASVANNSLDAFIEEIRSTNSCIRYYGETPL